MWKNYPNIGNARKDKSEVKKIAERLGDKWWKKKWKKWRENIRKETIFFLLQKMFYTLSSKNFFHKHLFTHFTYAVQFYVNRRCAFVFFSSLFGWWFLFCFLSMCLVYLMYFLFARTNRGRNSTLMLWFGYIYTIQTAT